MIRFVRQWPERSMGKPYSLDLRERVVAAIEEGMSTASGGGPVFDREMRRRGPGRG